tara:strand:+ start:236 stop:616 length:381 start_codon:yes stop_codon:yes gene_type:complete
MIKILTSYFSYNDDRGKIYGIINDFKIEELNIIESKKGSVRGNHYHKKTTELVFVIDGKIEVLAQKISNDGQLGSKEKIKVKKNDIFLIEPYLVHTFIAQEDSKWLNALSIKHDPENPDFHEIKLI